MFTFCIALPVRASKGWGRERSKKENEFCMDSRKIIYGVLKFMFHSSCVEKSLRAAVYLDGKENVLHDGKTKAKEQRNPRTEEN